VKLSYLSNIKPLNIMLHWGETQLRTWGIGY